MGTKRIIFDTFPEEFICPICETSENKKSFLLPIVGTDEGGNSKAQPFHIECVHELDFEYIQERKIIYSAIG